jgi:hypothetical protein
MVLRRVARRRGHLTITKSVWTMRKNDATLPGFGVGTDPIA